MSVDVKSQKKHKVVKEMLVTLPSSRLLPAVFFSVFILVIFYLRNVGQLVTQNDSLAHVTTSVEYKAAILPDSTNENSIKVFREGSFIDRFWEGDREYRPAKSYRSEIKKHCIDEVEYDPDEFKYIGPKSREKIPRSLNFAVHHKTGTHLLRNTMNLLIELSGGSQMHTGQCGVRFVRYPHWAKKLTFWCTLCQNLYHRNPDVRRVTLARDPMTMLISQHVYQTALWKAGNKFTDTLPTHNVFFKRLKANDTEGALLATIDFMAPVINDMLKHMNKTIGDREVLTLEMEKHFFRDFDDTMKKVFFHLLQDRVSAQTMCELRVKASFQNTHRFGKSVDQSHGSSHVASKDAKTLVTEELEAILTGNSEESKKRLEQVSRWQEQYKRYTEILWRNYDMYI